MSHNSETPRYRTRHDDNRPELSIAVVVDPIDLLENVNRAYGYEAGDRFLEALIRRLGDAEPTAAVGRRVDDEFVMTMPGDVDPIRAVDLASRLFKLAAVSIPEMDGPLQSRVVVAFDPFRTTPAETLLQAAEERMRLLASQGGYVATFEISDRMLNPLVRLLQRAEPT